MNNDKFVMLPAEEREWEMNKHHNRLRPKPSLLSYTRLLIAMRIHVHICTNSRGKSFNIRTNIIQHITRIIRAAETKF